MKKYVYKMTDPLSGKAYVGQTKDIIKRMYDHRHKDVNNFAHRATVEILACCWTSEGADATEAQMIIEHRTLAPFGFNRHTGGLRGFTVTEETRKRMRKPKSLEYIAKMSALRKGQPAWNKGIAADPAHMEKLRLSNIGRIPHNKGISWSDEVKQKIGEANRLAHAKRREAGLKMAKRVYSEDGLRRLKEANARRRGKPVPKLQGKPGPRKGVAVSEVTKQRMRDASARAKEARGGAPRKSRGPHSEETKRRIAESRRGKKASAAVLEKQALRIANGQASEAARKGHETRRRKTAEKATNFSDEP